MGFNEAYYAISARDYQWDTFTPTVCPTFDGADCRAHLKVPPLLSTLIAILPDGEFWTRLPSLLAWVGSIVLAYRLRGEWAALAMTASPWLFLWMGRAQTESLLAFALILTVYGLERDRPWAWLLGIMVGLLTKQTYVLAFPLFLRRDWWVNPKPPFAFFAAFPALAWWRLQAQTHPTVFVEDWLFHIQGRQAAFAEAWPEVLALGLVLGFLPFLALLRPRADWRLTTTAALFALFALLNAPHSHSYYTVPALALAALQVRRPAWGCPWASRGILAGAISLSLLAATAGGELDRPVLTEALQAHPGVYVQSSLWPQADYYGVPYLIEGDGCPAAPNRTILCNRTPPGCQLVEAWRGFMNHLVLSWCPP